MSPSPTPIPSTPRTRTPPNRPRRPGSTPRACSSASSTSACAGSPPGWAERGSRTNRAVHGPRDVGGEGLALLLVFQAPHEDDEHEGPGAVDDRRVVVDLRDAPGLVGDGCAGGQPGRDGVV